MDSIIASVHDLLREESGGVPVAAVIETVAEDRGVGELTVTDGIEEEIRRGTLYLVGEDDRLKRTAG